MAQTNARGGVILNSITDVATTLEFNSDIANDVLSLPESDFIMVLNTGVGVAADGYRPNREVIHVATRTGYILSGITRGYEDGIAGGLARAWDAGTRCTQDFTMGMINLATTGIPAHNDTTGKQGGTTDEYYHLTAAQVTLVNEAVQGSGNNFDADTVDGKHASEFALNTDIPGLIDLTGYQLTSELIGEVKMGLWLTPPPRFLLNNGDSIPNGNGIVQGVTDDFSALYTHLMAVIGVDTLIDDRGHFHRSLGGIDTGRTIGSTQKGSIVMFDVTASATAVVAMGTDSTSSGNAQNDFGLDYIATNTDYLNADRRDGSAGAGEAPCTNGSEAGFGISRPTNVAYLSCIRYK